MRMRVERGGMLISGKNEGGEKTEKINYTG